jgi:Cysteine-rich secretory protein family
VSAADVAVIVGKHNECRANVSPPAAKPIPPIVWDASVAASAQAYADTCSCSEGHAPADQVSYNIITSHSMLHVTSSTTIHYTVKSYTQ